MPWRIPIKDRALFVEQLVEKAAMPAGVKLSFQSDADWVNIKCNASDDRSPLDLFINGEFRKTVDTVGVTEIRFDSLGPGNKVFEAWLPQYGEFRFGGLRLSEGSYFSAHKSKNLPRWVTYGSSITQCREAYSPSLTWPSIVARSRKNDLTCLGYGGQCHLDPLIARVIRDRDADLISLCLGINIYGNASLNERTFGSGIIGFIEIIREKHPDTPMVIFSPIYSPDREVYPNAVGFTLSQMRVEIEEAVRRLYKHGDRNIHYVNGLDIFNEKHAHLLPDGLHPNTEGYGIMAANMLTALEQFCPKQNDLVGRNLPCPRW
jgi:lysophospholipase L1-like esterase